MTRRETIDKLIRDKRQLTHIPGRERHVIVAPTVTRRPQLDVMLGKMTVVAEFILDDLNQKALDRIPLGRDEIKAFNEVAQTIIRQTRTEMDVEKHVEERAKRQNDADLARSLARKLLDRGFGEDVVEAVLDELELEL